ncbi:MAG: DMT family transporter [Clostridia bacterium]|nr:DMT family transporter [Clostridia bacterium]
MRHTQPKGVLFLLLAAFLWGSSFVAMSIGTESLRAFSFSTLRCLFALIFLVPAVAVQDVRNRKRMSEGERAAYVGAKHNALLFGVPLGVCIFAGTNLQQIALSYTSPGKVAFITALYMVFVPLVMLFFGKKSRALLWGAVILGAVGLYLLSIGDEGFTAVNIGDVLSLFAALAFTAQIVLVDRFAPKTDALALCAVQFAVAGVLAAALMLVFESPNDGDFVRALLPAAYVGVLASGVAYTLQIVGQARTDPTLATLAMCAESVFAVLCAMVLLRQIPTAREAAGIVLMLVAIVGAQFATKDKVSPDPKRNP